MQKYTAKTSAVLPYFFHGSRSTLVLAQKYFLTFLNDLGNSKHFELYLSSITSEKMGQVTFFATKVQWCYLEMICYNVTFYPQDFLSKNRGGNPGNLDDIPEQLGP